MKKGLILLPLIALMLIAPAAMATTDTSVTSSPPVTLYFQVYGCQYQWRGFSLAYPGGPWGAWSFYSYYGQQSDGPFVLEHNTLTTTLTFEPTVTDQIPTVASLVYTFNPELNIWILPPTTLSYLYTTYGPYRVTDIFTGFIAFNGAPSSANYAEDVMYQWEYIFGVPHHGTAATTLLTYDQNAVWDCQVGAWQVGLSVYVDNAAQTLVVTNNGAGLTTAYPTPPTGSTTLQPGQVTGIPFPSIYVPIEPYGPDNYDPLHL